MTPPRHLVLLGDSILDNAPYTDPAPDTSTHLTAALGHGWRVELLARDGACMEHLCYQLDDLEGTADTAVLSIGGNDLTQHLGILDQPAQGSSQILHQLGTLGDEFDLRYAQVVRATMARARRTILCTIYEVQLEPVDHAVLARVPLAIINDRICRVAVACGADILELRTVCTAPEDFVRQIEPSAQGAQKIANAIAKTLRVTDAEIGTRVFSG